MPDVLAGQIKRLRYLYASVIRSEPSHVVWLQERYAGCQVCLYNPLKTYGRHSVAIQGWRGQGQGSHASATKRLERASPEEAAAQQPFT